MVQQTWLRIEGTLTEGGWQYIAKPGHEARRIPTEFASQLANQAPTPVEAVLLNSAGNVIARATPRLAQAACGTRAAAAKVRVAAYLPLLPGAASYEIRNASVALHHAPIPGAVPAVQITSCVLEGDNVHVQWQAEGPVGSPLHFSVACILSGRTFPLAVWTKHHHLTANLSSVPGPGQANISVLASDGVRSALALSEKFELPPRPPVLTIISPQDQGSYGYHEPIPLAASATDAGGRTLPEQGMVWLCDGEVVAQDQRAALLTNSSPGAHRVTLAAGEAEVSVTITVREQTASEREWARIFEIQRRSGN